MLQCSYPYKEKSDGAFIYFLFIYVYLINNFTKKKKHNITSPTPDAFDMLVQRLIS